MRACVCVGWGGGRILIGRSPHTAQAEKIARKLLKKTNAATKLQGLWRGHVDRQRVSKLRAASKTVPLVSASYYELTPEEEAGMASDGSYAFE